MRGNWHIIALIVLLAALSVILNINLFFFVFIWLLYLFYDNRISMIVFSVAVLSFFFYYQHIPQLEIATNEKLQQNIKESYQGRIVGEPILNEAKIEFVMEENKQVGRILILYFPNQEEVDTLLLGQIKYGARCDVRGELELPDQATNPGQFDYQKFLLTKNIKYQIILKDLSALECEGSSFFQRFYTLRHKLLGGVPDKLSPYTSAWLTALVLGDRSQIDEETIDVFQRWSLTHLLAISGLHIGIIVAIVYFGLVRLNLLTKEKAELLILCSLPIYAILTGGQPSVLRAVSMVVLVLLARRLQLKFQAHDVISIVFVLLVLFQPYIIYHIGFQFSFIITFGLILTRKWLAQIASSGYQALMISFVSQMVILPLQLDYFSILQPLSIPLNLIIVPYFSIIVIPFMFLLLLFSFLPASILQFFDRLFMSMHQLVISWISSVDHFLDFPLFLTNIPIWLYISYYTVLFLAFFYLQMKRLKHAFIAFICLVLLIFGYASAPYFSPKGYVTMLDIGQGDAFIIELPYRKGVYMIDAGARFSFEDMQPTDSVYKQVIEPYLRSKGIHKLDALFLTHNDLDHIGSVNMMLEDGIVKAVYISEYFPAEELFSEEVEQLEQGETVSIDEHILTVLSPYQDKQDSNANSLVLYTEIGGRSWLFTGDITKEEERDIINKYNINVDVLKVAHHGSNTSTDPLFIEEINAKTALIPVGRNNRYGHPTQEVIGVLEKHGLQIFRTDIHGAVQYQFIDNNGNFSIFNKD